MTSDFILNTKVLRNDEIVKGRFVARKDESIAISMTIPTSNFVFLKPSVIAPYTISSISDETTWQLTKTCSQIYEKGENIFFQVVEKLGNGKVILHTIGLVRIGHEWHMEQTEQEIQFFALESGNFYSDSTLDLKDFQSMIEIVENDANVPTISEYVEIVPEDGTVVSFNPFNHVGVIKTSRGLAMFHRKDVRRNSSTCVRPGTKVDYILIKQEGFTFPFKAVDVGYPHEDI